MKKRLCSILLVLVMAISLLPTAAFAAGGDFDVDIVATKFSAVKYNEKETMKLDFMMRTSNGAKIRGIQTALLAVDLSKFDVVYYYSGTVYDGTSTICPEGSTGSDTSGTFAYSTYMQTPLKKINGEVVGRKTSSTGFLSMNANATTNEYSFDTSTSMMSILLGLKDGAEWSALPSNSVRLATAAEANTFNATGVVTVNDSDGKAFVFRHKDGAGSDTLTIAPTLASDGSFTFVAPPKPAYTGTIDAPKVKTNAGGKVVLNDAVLTPADSAAKIKYGYSKTNDGKNTTWQDSTTFNLTVGNTYYFYAKVVETMEYTEKVSAASVAVPVADKAAPTITTLPTADAITYGQKLSNSNLTGGEAKVDSAAISGTFAWKTPSTAPEVKDSNSTKYDVVFTPEDTTNYESATCEVKLTVNPKSLTDVAVEDIAAQAYTGSQITPAVNVKGDGGKKLVKDKDYTVDYGANNTTGTGAGTVTVKAKTDGNYTFGNVVKHFDINAGSADDTLKGKLKATHTPYTGTYNGTAHDAFTVGTLPSGWTVQYADSESGSYSGAMPQVTNVSDSKTLWVKFSNSSYSDFVTSYSVSVTARDISGAAITLNTVPTYDGTEKQVTINSVTVDGSPLNTGDYDIVAGTDKATNVESKELKITGKGNYKGTATKKWSLQKATPDVSDFDLTPATPDPSGYNYGSFGGLSAPTATKTGMGGVTVKYNGNATVPTDAGTYTVTFDVAEGTNYNTKTGLSIGTLKINQIDYAGVKIATDTVRSGHATTDKALTLPTLPAGASYAASGTVGGATAALIDSHSVSGTILTYSTTAQTAGTKATITIPVTGATNYKDYNVTVTITAQDKQTLTIAGVVMDESSYTYGDAVGYNNSSLSVTGATAFNNDDLEYIYSGTPTDGSTFTTGTAAPTKAGSYTLTVKVPDTNVDYMGQQVINFSIAPKALRSSDLAQTAGANTKTYNGNAAAPGITVGVKPESLVETTDVVTITGSAVYNSENVSEAAQIIFTPAGTGNDNYTLDASATLTIEGASITAKDVSITGATVNNKDYDGNTNATVASVTIPGVSGPLNMGTDFEVTSAVFSDTNASTINIDVTINVALKGTAASNYHLTNGTDYPVSGAAKINQATLSEGTDKSDSIRYSDTTEKTFDAAYFGFTKAGTFALNVSVTDSSNVLAAGFPTCDSTVKVKLDTVASLASPAQRVIIPLTFTTSDGNYVGKNVTLTITLTDKTPVTISGLTYADKTYDGNAITPAGTLAVSDNRVPVNELEVLYTSTDGAGYSAATAPKDAGAYKVEYKVADSNPNYTGSESYTFTISKKDATAAPKAVSITKGSAIPTTFELVYTGLVSGESLTPTPDPSFTCFEADGSTPVSTSTAAGTYTITWTNEGTTTFTGADNYDVTKTATATLTISNPSYSGGGSYTPSYTVSVDKTENGTITVSPKSASKGDTVTITVKPDKGYELEMLKALDKDGDALKLTEKNGKYTFKMPSGKVTVKGSFVEEAPVQIFKDVPVDAYYYEAVKWAAEKGITGGVGNGLFAPNQPCTRGQIVTFLWRAAGSPAPKNMSSFADVPADAFYAKAVAWAVENGITGGTGDGKFSPDATCTRAQAVTFLYRAAGSPKVSGSAEFSDVATNAYYADAVAWAAKNGITTGIGGGQFGSDNNCTRAQIVTFLYRSVK